MRTSSSFFLLALFGLACDGGRDPAVVLVQQSCATTPNGEHCSVSAQAYFFDPPPERIDCTRTTLSSCVVLECEHSGVALPEPVARNAGTVTIDGLLEGPLSVAFLDGGYPTAWRRTRGWHGGETLTVSASGGDVPAFSDVRLNAPGDIELTAPPCRAGHCGAFSRAADLPIAWKAPAGTGLHVTLSSTGVAGTVHITCDFATSPAVIPAAAMSRLLIRPPELQHTGPGAPLGGQGGINGPWLFVAPMTETTVSAGAWDVRVVALTNPHGLGFTVED